MFSIKMSLIMSTQVFADLDYCGKRFGDNRRFQYTAIALHRSYREGPRKVGSVREVSVGQVVAR